MASLREIQRRMSSIKSTMQITRTMEMISTARIHKALVRAEEAEPYKDAITRMLANVAEAGFSSGQPLLAQRTEEKHVLFILVASDKGLAGGFNIVQQRAVETEMRRLKARGIESSVITCGRKPTEYFTYRKMAPVMSFVGISSEPNQDEADRIASYVMRGYATGEIDRVVLYYWHAKNRVEQTQVVEQLLPISKEQLTMPKQAARARGAHHGRGPRLHRLRLRPLCGGGPGPPHARLLQDGHLPRAARLGRRGARCAPPRHAVRDRQRARGSGYARAQLQPGPPGLHHH